MKFSTIVTVATLTALSGLNAIAAADEQPQTLNEWLEGAGEAVNEVMYFPRISQRTAQSGVAIFEVTIDRNGNVKSFETEEETGYGALDAAARRVVGKADFPAIPANYVYDEMTFDLVLNYHVKGGPGYRNSKELRQGETEIRELADRRRSQTASIKIHRPTGR